MEANAATAASGVLMSLPAIVCLAVAGCSVPTTGFLSRTFKGPDGETAKDSRFVPHAYSAEKPVPVIVSPRAGEAGNDGVKPTQVGVGPAVRGARRVFPSS